VRYPPTAAVIPCAVVVDIVAEMSDPPSSSAIEVSQRQHSGSAYLSPNTREPQQKIKHRNPTQHKDRVASHPPKSNGQRDMSPHISNDILRGITKHQYAQDNILQSYEQYVPEPEPAKSPKYWIVFIHGGYFRDPLVTSSSFYPALELLASEKHRDPDSIRPFIAGYATINYRLSPDGGKNPQDPDKTPAYELQNAQWPQHIHDVLAAIAHLQARHGFGERYVLAGHSVGATMAMLSALSSQQSPFTHASGLQMPRIEPPTAVLGVSGIYDFPLIHKTFPGYDQMTRNAIHDEADDVLASPAKYSAQDYQAAWAAGGKTRVLVIAHSRDDGLVDWQQPEEMRKAMEGAEGINVKFLEIHGDHDGIFEKGTELARAIVETVKTVRALGR
jgi:kynurenine formamidase